MRTTGHRYKLAKKRCAGSNREQTIEVLTEGVECMERPARNSGISSVTSSLSGDVFKGRPGVHWRQLLYVATISRGHDYFIV